MPRPPINDEDDVPARHGWLRRKNAELRILKAARP